MAAVSAVNFPELIQHLEAQHPPAARLPREINYNTRFFLLGLVGNAALLATKISPFINGIFTGLLLLRLSVINDRSYKIRVEHMKAKAPHIHYHFIIYTLKNSNYRTCQDIIQYVVDNTRKDPKNFTEKEWIAIRKFTECTDDVNAKLIASQFGINSPTPIPVDLKFVERIPAAHFLSRLPPKPQAEYKGIAAKINNLAIIAIPVIGLLLGVSISAMAGSGAFIAGSALYYLGDLMYKSYYQPKDPCRNMRSDLQSSTFGPALVTLLKAYIMQSKNLFIESKKMHEIYKFYYHLTIIDADPNDLQKDWQRIVGKEDCALPDLKNLPKRRIS